MLAQIELDDSIQQTLDDVATFVPKLVGAIIIFVIGWFVARMIRKLFHALLTRVNFDKLVDRSGLGAHVERAGYPDSGALLAKIVYWGLMLIVLSSRSACSARTRCRTPSTTSSTTSRTCSWRS